jgi:hypothetical protein
MRKLIYIPIIHTEEDMGSMSGGMKQIYIRQYGTAKWKKHVKTVNEVWAGIKQKISNLELDYGRVKIYQDGLPLCGMETAIMEDVASRGSHNYIIIKELVKHGAVLIGTEDPKLLIEEYNFYKKIMEMPHIELRNEAMQKAKKRRDELLVERDKFIAGRIKDTIGANETGILFLGLEHEANKYIPADIKVEYLIYRLPFKELIKNQ